MPGRSTLTATSRPSFSTAKCTWAIEALATGAASKLVKTLSIGRPKARSTVSRATASGKGGTRSCSLASSLAMSAGIRSRRVEMTWPNLTKIGPSVSSPRRSRSPRGAGNLRPMVRTRARTRTQRWRKLDSASSSRPKRKTVTQMKISRERCLIGAAARGPASRPGGRRAGQSRRASWRHRGSPWRPRCRSGRSRAPARRPTSRARSSCTSQRRFSISQLTSVAKAASPSTRELRPLADDEPGERQRRIGGVDRHPQVGRQGRRRPTRPTRRAPAR